MVFGSVSHLTHCIRSFGLLSFCTLVLLDLCSFALVLENGRIIIIEFENFEFFQNIGRKEGFFCYIKNTAKTIDG